mgnify:CR=1 FL=1
MCIRSELDGAVIEHMCPFLCKIAQNLSVCFRPKADTRVFKKYKSSIALYCKYSTPIKV